MKKYWNLDDMPSLTGRTAIVTGTGGLGHQVAGDLARAGASVIVAGRNPYHGAVAVGTIERHVPNADVVFEEIDLASLGSVRAFANRIKAGGVKPCLLINNAAVMTPPTRRSTSDGHELQWGTNYLGHFALTAALAPLLASSGDGRVVTLSSVAARQGAIRFEDLSSVESYNPMAAYAQSKLACLMFGLELDRRARRANVALRSMVAHPGIARTNLLTNGAGEGSVPALARKYLWFLFQPVAQAALPVLYAATAPDATPGAYYGPAWLSETRGPPTLASVPAAASCEMTASRLWDVSEEMAGIRFLFEEVQA